MAQRGINKVILVVTLGQDPEVKYMPNGDAVCNVSGATSEVWKDQQGQKQERTEWHRIVMFRKLAEIAGQFLRKGSQAYFEGRLQTRKWTDSNGIERYTTEIVADQMQMLGVNPNQQSGSRQGGQGYQNPQNPTYQQGQRPQQPQQQAAEPDFDDDIPFAPVGLQYPALLNCC